MALSALAGCQVVSAPAPSPVAMRRIGYLTLSSRADNQPFFAAFVDQLQKLGWVEGQNLAIEWRFADSHIEVLSDLIADLLRLPVEVIVVPAASAAEPVRQQTSTVPIVMINGPDLDTPSAVGMAQSYARPGYNVTGTSMGFVALATKSVELLRTVLPQATRMALLADKSTAAYVDGIPVMRATAQKLGLETQYFDVPGVAGVDGAFQAAVAWGAEALLIPGNAKFGSDVYLRTAALAAENHLPAMYTNAAAVTEDGGLMAISTGQVAGYRRGADYVDRILRGATPADLPIEGPRQFDFIVNVNAAHALGITLPPDAAAQVTQWIQ